ncbi:alkaline phosphatase family protein [Desulfobulbus sp. AH-315-M07]|nr:alkaline phosphatase family protein [Desulfobulbus sp. AH-315-M07]
MVMITVDQGRYDYPLPRPIGYGTPPRKSGGYQTFFEQGTVFDNALYAHSVTVTEPGHMTLVTGGNPDTHGIPRNQWLDRNTGEFVNDIYDSSYWIVGNTTKTRSSKPGTAPTALLKNTGTLGDRLVESTNGKAKVFSVGMWDWPAIPMAGEKGRALWYDETSGEFVSSSYFYSELPPWLEAWNQTDPAKRFLDANVPRDPRSGAWVWKPLTDTASYRNAETSVVNAPFVRPPCYPSQSDCQYSLGATFDHLLPNQTPQEVKMTRYLMQWTPFSDAVLVELATELVRQEQLGQDDVTDLLMINLASNDLIGHMWGPDSLEHEDNFYRLDATLARCLASLRDVVPQEHLLVVLAADHGMNSIPEYLQRQGKHAGRLVLKTIVDRANVALLDAYGVKKLAVGMRPPSLFLDLPKIRAAGLDVNDVARRTVETILAMDGVRFAWTKQDLIDRKVVPKEQVEFAALMRSSVDLNPTDRSGEVLVVQEEYWFFHEYEVDAAMHGSPYDYSRHVQLMFWGGPIEQARVERPVAPRDLVPTLAMILDLEPPKASTGTALKEVFSAYRP